MRTRIRFFLVCLCSLLIAGAGSMAAWGTETQDDLEKELLQMYGAEAFDEEEPEISDEQMQKELEKYSDLENWSTDIQMIRNPEFKVTYDAEKKTYYHELEPECGFDLSVPDGGISTTPVSLYVDSNMSVYDVTCDGKRVSIADTGLYTDPGSYQVSCISKPAALDKIGDLYQFEIYFQIIPEYLSEQNVVTAPVGFEVEQVWMGAREIDHQKKYLILDQDGPYRILFGNKNGCTYQLVFAVDNHAPALEFSQPIYGARVKPPVNFRAKEDGCVTEVYRNGKQLVNASGPIEDGGTYLVRVTDRAGNQRDYSFEVANRMRFDGIWWKIGCAMLICLGIPWLWYLRRHLDVL